ncbi:hypothetical protein ACSCBZ_42485 [Streptomyces niveiscabiei]|uniref:hypothetical protein n=1 Tax=Streptomyces niveiscabiei TaxID=164115 RepID=UPI0006EB40E9|nr:hypothetical protein [Streptomyces niveiscabiei]
MTDASRTSLLKPGDTLLIGNVGQTGADALDALHEGMAKLRAALAPRTAPGPSSERRPWWSAYPPRQAR